MKLKIHSPFFYYLRMRLPEILPTTIAAGLLILTIGLAVLSILSGGTSIVFPGLGLIVSLIFIILLLAIINAAIISPALFIRSINGKRQGL